MNVSVYVPCYNGAAWLLGCLESLLAQTHPADEVFLVDDGSTDDSSAIAERFGSAVRVLVHDRNRGLAAARNTALAAATGDIVASVDADVQPAPIWLARLLDGFITPRTAAVGGKLLEAHQQTLPDQWRAAHMAQHNGGFPLVNPSVLAGANCAIRRDIVRRVGGYDVSFRTNYEDVDLQHRLVAGGYMVCYVPGAVAYHQRRDTATSVLRTFWSWLRPPAERRGLFRDPSGLLVRQREVAARALQCLWQDFSNGQAFLAYVSLLVMVAFPIADRRHAANARPSDGEAAALFHASSSELASALPEILAFRSAGLAAVIAGDLERVAWWSPPITREPSRTASCDPVEQAVEALCDAICTVPRAWWPSIEDARDELAADQNWSESAAGRPIVFGAQARPPR